MVRLRRDTRKFKVRAVNSLLLAIEIFNRPHDMGRTESVLILLQHAFEMLLKGAIHQQRGTIYEKTEDTSYGFTRCRNIAYSELHIITEDESCSLAILCGLRDCAMHNLVDLSEDSLYLHTQASVTIFNSVLLKAYEERLGDYLSSRVLPVSTNPPRDISTFLSGEFSMIRDLLKPGKRMQAEAKGRIRYHMILESCVKGENKQPNESEVSSVIRQVKEGQQWDKLFPGVASLHLDTAGQGLTYSVRITRHSASHPTAEPVRVLKSGEVGSAQATVIREVSLQDRFSMGQKNLADKLRITSPKMRALIYHLNLGDDSDCLHEFSFGKTTFIRYSPKALEKLTEALKVVDIDQIWIEYWNSIKPVKQ